jgi:hypothetical protein
MAYIGVSPSNGVRRVHTYTATASQTTFSGAGAEGTSLSYKDSNFVDVYQNGVKLGDADYTATSGTSIVLGTGATASDLVVIVVFDVFSVADTVSKADGGTFDGNVTMGGTLGVTGASTLTGALSAKGGAVFNEDSADVDFRVESNDTANALVVNGGTNKVGIGTDSPVHPLHVQSSTDGTGLSSDNLFVAFFNNAEATNDRSFGLKVSAGSTTADEVLRLTDHDQSNTHLVVLGNGDVCISRTTSLTAGRMSMDFASASDNGFCINDTSSGNGAAFINFHSGGTSRGTITNNNNTAVAYNTTSDYRLKENVDYSFDATTELKKLKPCKFNFTADKDRIVEGFLAHEVQDIVPQAITGKKDEVDEDGNPVYQGIDQAKLVPLLTKTLQEALTRIDTLEAEVKALKG